MDEFEGRQGFSILSDRHLVTAAEAAFANGLGATFYPGAHKPFYVAEINPQEPDQPHLFWLYHFTVKVVDANDRYRQGLLVSLASILPNDTGSMPLNTALQSSETEFANFIAPQGYPVLQGIRWRVWFGLAADDLVVCRAVYKIGGRA